MAGEQSAKDIVIVGEPSLQTPPPPPSLSAEARADAAAFKGRCPPPLKGKISHHFPPWSLTGGGIIGCSTAYYLTRHPSYDPARHRITLFEATKIAGGASGKAGGLLALWAYPSSIVPLSWRLHDELAREHNGAERWGYRRLHAGTLDAQPSSPTILAEGDETRKPDDGAGGLPEDLAWLDPATSFSYSSLGNPSNTAQVHPYQFTTSMASLAAEKGVKIILGSVTDIHYTNAASPTQSSSKKGGNSSAAKTVSSITYTSTSSTATPTPQTHPATTVILAGGPWTPTLLPNLRITAHRAHSIVLQPPSGGVGISAHALFTSLSGPSTCSPEIYPRPDSTVYACGPTDTRAPLPPTTALVRADPAACRAIRERVSAVSPALRDAAVETEQACYLPGGGPWVGPVAAGGVCVAAGHTCWGVMNAPATGLLVAEMVFEGKAKSANVRALDPRKGMV